MTNTDQPRFTILAAIILFALLIAGALVFLVPIGEAPDEPAHLTYVAHIVREGHLPEVKEAPAEFQYESHQPPLAYALMAGGIHVAGSKDITFEFVRDPAFHFEQGARALLAPLSTSSQAVTQRAARTARAVNLLWLVVIEVMILLMCLRVASSLATAIASALPFCFAPQLLFTCATANNDAAVTALSSIAVLGLFVLVTDGRQRPMTAIIVSFAAGLALWSKISAVFLVPGLAVVAAISVQTRRWRTLAALFLPGLLLTGVWLLFSITRTGSITPLPAEELGMAPGGLGRVLADPSWVLSVWGGFWAKLGWFNLPLPKPFYLAFLPASLAALIGFSVVYIVPRLRSAANLLLSLALAMNVVILLIYMVRVDWQPQGRYLLPSIVAIAGLATLGLEWLIQRFKMSAAPQIAMTSAACSFIVAVTTLVVVATNY